MKNDNNATEEDNNIDQSLSSSHNNNHAETVNTLVRENAKTINNANAKDNEKSQKVNWWINELDSLGMKESNSNDKKESNKSQELEDLTDYIKQKFICDYKACYRE